MAGCLSRLGELIGSSTLELELLLRSDAPEEFEAITPKVLLPATSFNTEADANRLWETVAAQLIDDGVGPANALQEADAIFEELALNAAQHSLSPSGCSAIVECVLSDGGVFYVIGVADAGIGIPSSLRKNRRYEQVANDDEAVALATEPDVTGTMENRGVGLYHVKERVLAYRGELSIISGGGFFMIRGGELISGGSTGMANPYRGTIVLAALPIPPIA